ncbi:hypothetical protein MA16_Dca024455 [Dendrobium catenatum]|uniref:Uncharacterized protein n=1 Tax=Dendrobium catenatum TaxID=906689 RepID=A0A2I0WRC9_9ASPA|nr:hypothetical protein MA16_Dca024455 [Dendrobium catenatum]
MMMCCGVLEVQCKSVLTVTTFLRLLDSVKQEQKEQEVDFYKARETGSLPTTNDLIGRG